MGEKNEQTVPLEKYLDIIERLSALSKIAADFNKQIDKFPDDCQGASGDAPTEQLPGILGQDGMAGSATVTDLLNNGDKMCAYWKGLSGAKTFKILDCGSVDFAIPALLTQEQEADILKEKWKHLAHNFTSCSDIHTIRHQENWHNYQRHRERNSIHETGPHVNAGGHPGQALQDHPDHPSHRENIESNRKPAFRILARQHRQAKTECAQQHRTAGRPERRTPARPVRRRHPHTARRSSESGWSEEEKEGRQKEVFDKLQEVKEKIVVDIDIFLILCVFVPTFRRCK